MQITTAKIIRVLCKSLRQK